MATWRKLIKNRMDEIGDSFDNLVEHVYSLGNIPDFEYYKEVKARYIKKKGSWLDVEFDDDFGGSKGCDFTLWTKNNVYFPVVYDGSEWVGSVPRNPSNRASKHWGGE